jgi:hypothetical protein
MNQIIVYIPDGEPAQETGRNGTFEIKAVRVSGGSTTCFIDGIGKRGRQLAINGGFRVPAEVMDEIAEQWLRSRGRIS